MKVQSYRDPTLFSQLLEKAIPLLLEVRESLGRKIRMMEVCGTHTVSFSKTGVRELLSDFVELMSGPGCPVCVTDQTDLDRMISLGQQKGTMIATYGDMMKVPGTHSTLVQERANGVDVRMVNSATQALELAIEHPHHEVVFLGVGFETTAPSAALAIQRASRENIRNFSVYSAHKCTPPALEALIQAKHEIDGFLLPGHVSVIIGRKGWSFLERYNQPAVIGGFEPLDLLASTYILVKEMRKPRRQVVNHYRRMVKEDGNERAQQVLGEVFQPVSSQWRGFGMLPDSGLELKPFYRDQDAKFRFSWEAPRSRSVRGCRCGEVITGKLTPLSCGLFAKTCTPEKPLGPCMVSSEGTCSTYYFYERGGKP
ncbi:hydrogenase formation protein HypD [Ammoniphilus sp. CFH 90114]|uniref:hydrogenase formation protein HypD n=1 Tax=Ammoniphilus sp. CFH 90114 TaxID=2493665 RepID=UPI00100F178F|nr:hydrogenase formation protein HypD [Ammoniphilus sp. CFH 90114]RXT07953.1 hydrogenase formation protein HypD [Ammoniphilus sp. CFH 90114]